MKKEDLVVIALALLGMASKKKEEAPAPAKPSIEEVVTQPAVPEITQPATPAPPPTPAPTLTPTPPAPQPTQTSQPATPTPQPTLPAPSPPPPPPPEVVLGASVDIWFTYDAQIYGNLSRTLKIATDISGIEVIIYNFCSYPARLQIDSQVVEVPGATGWGGGVMASTKTLTLPPKASYVFKLLTQLQTPYDHVDLSLNIKSSKPLSVDCGGYVCGVAPQITVS